MERQKARTVSEVRQEFPLKELLRLTDLARNTYYYHLKRRDSDKYGGSRQEIRQAFAGNMRRYDYRRVLPALCRKGTVVNHKTVLRLMREMELRGNVRRRRYQPYKGEAGIPAPNVLSRDFNAAKPFEKLATDVTELAVCSRKVCLSPVPDLHDNEILSCSISLSPSFAQTHKMPGGLFGRLAARRDSEATLRPWLEVSNGGVPATAAGARHSAEHVAERQLLEQRHDGMLLRAAEERDVPERAVQDGGRPVSCLEAYIRYWNDDRLSLALDGMPPDAIPESPTGGLGIFMSNFWGA